MNLAATVHESQDEEGLPSIIDRSFLELNIDEPIERINSCKKIFGREERQRCLFDTFNNSLDNRKVNIAIIKGDTGCGKTALVNSFRDELRQTNGTLLEWTCERQAMLQLYSGFTNALPKWVQDILSCESDKVDSLKSRVQNCLDSKEIGILIQCWPILTSFFGIETNIVQEDSNDKCNWGLLLKFLVAFSSKDFPLFIWVDDLHWIDNISFQWILNLIQSTFVSTEGMSFVLSYNHPWDEGEEALFWKQGINDLKSNRKLHVFEMTMENLDQNALTNWVDYVLGTTAPESTIRVSHYLYTRTNGHPLYTKELLRYLLDNSCINYSRLTKSWEVTMKDRLIQQSIEMCSSAADYASMRLQNISSETIQVLHVAACLGYHINSGLVSCVISYDVVSHLEDATKADIVTCSVNKHDSKIMSTVRKVSNSFSVKEFAFINNTMHQAVMDHIGGTKEIHKLHLSIARKLIQNLSDYDLQSNLIAIVRLVIQGVDYIRDQERHSFAALALDAARKAVTWTSVTSAEQFIDFAIKMLNEDCWEAEYALSLQIYNAAAEIFYACGDFKRVDVIITQVLNKATSFEDKLQAFSTKLYMLGSNDQPSEAITLGLGLLEQLGERFPLHPKRRHLLSAYVKVKVILKAKSDEMILRMPIITNEHAAACLKIMNVLFPSTFILRPLLVPLIALRMIEVSLKFGMSAESSVAFGLLGILLVSNHRNMSDGIRMGDLSLKLLDRFQGRSWIPRLYAIVYGFIHGWHRPIQEAIDQLFRGYQIALETGDIEFAMVNIFTYLYFLFDSGIPLGKIKEQHQNYVENLSSRHSNATIFMQTNFFFIMDTLMSEQDTSLFSNDHVTQNDVVLNFNASMVILFTAVLGNYQQTVDVGKTFCRKFPFEVFDFASYYMLIGIANIAVCKQRGRKNPRRLITACYYRRKIKRICNTAVPDSWSKLFLLEAELSSLSHCRHSEATQKFKAAISLADSKHHCFEAAFARERYARYLLSRGDISTAHEMLQSSCNHYHEWNAYRKVNLLQEELDITALQT